MSLVKLNIGCGPNIFPYPGWTNYDHDEQNEYFYYIKLVVEGLTSNPPNPYYINVFNNMTKEQRNVVNYFINGGSANIIKHDIMSGLPQHQDNSVDIIYLGQIIEHLNIIYQVPKVLNECFRVLKPGGVIRITTPDLDLLLNAYFNNDMDKFAPEQPEFYKLADPGSKLCFLMFGASGPNCTFNNYEGHMFIFNKFSIRNCLLNSGFKDVYFYYEPHKSVNPILAEEAVDTGLSHSFIVEAVK